MWIQTTASMEHLAVAHLRERESRSDGGSARVVDAPTDVSGVLRHDLRMPRFMRDLVQRLLRGDADMAHLVARHSRGVLRGRGNATSLLDSEGHASPRATRFLGPRAIRAQLWLYRFSSTSALLRHGKWWQREALSLPVIYALAPGEGAMATTSPVALAKGVAAPSIGRPASASAPAQNGNRVAGEDTSPHLRATPWVRHRLLHLSTLGAAASLDSIIRGRRPWAMLAALCVYAAVLLVIGSADYGAFPILASFLRRTAAHMSARAFVASPAGVVAPALSTAIDGVAGALARSQPHDAVRAVAAASFSALAIVGSAAWWTGSWRGLKVWHHPVREALVLAIVPAALCWSALFAE